MTTLTEKIEVMQAFERGEKIVWIDKLDQSDNWRNCAAPLWNWDCIEYRVAEPEPKKVKLLAWIEQGTGYLNFRLESFGEPKHSASVRVPSEDKEITL
jgi:hypothetical protein